MKTMTPKQRPPADESGGRLCSGWSRASLIWAALCALAVPSSCLPAQKSGKLPREVAPQVVQLAELPKNDFKECSGLVVSRQFPGVLWTHNDGKDRRLFAIDRQGKKLAEFEVQGVFIWDWEDLAIDDTNRLYVADIGNNLQVRPSLSVHRVAEPDPATSGQPLKVEQSWLLRFPKTGFDAEGLFIWQDRGYLVAKTGKGKKAALYRWSLDAGATATLEEIGKLEVKSPITAADLSPNGTQLGLTADDGVYVFQFAAGPENAVSQKPFKVPFKLGQIEGCSFDRDGLLVVSEGRELFLFKAEPFRLGASR
jgi:hypothetical protein